MNGPFPLKICFSPHFSPGICCNVESARTYFVALARPPQRSVLVVFNRRATQRERIHRSSNATVFTKRATKALHKRICPDPSEIRHSGGLLFLALPSRGHKKSVLSHSPTESFTPAHNAHLLPADGVSRDNSRILLCCEFFQ